MPFAHPRFAVIGHRGSPRRAPENTPASFERALAEGCDGIEADARMLADGLAVLFHDDRIAGRVVETLTLDELGALAGEVTLLQDLAPLSARGSVVVEVKRRGWEEQLQSIVRRFSTLPTVSSFDHRVIATLAAHGYDGRLGIVFYGCPAEIERYCLQAGASVVFPNVAYVDVDLVSRCRDGAIDVVPWTANTTEEWERLASLGCSGVITDHPAEAVQWRAAALKC